MCLLALWPAFLVVAFVGLFAPEGISEGFPSVRATLGVPVLWEAWTPTRASIILYCEGLADAFQPLIS